MRTPEQKTPEQSRVEADEAAVEKHYSNALAERARLLRTSLSQINRNSWTGSVNMTIPKHGSLIGRVALQNANDEYLEGARDFYIGTEHHAGSDYEVFSWVAPVACTFYRKSSEHHGLCHEVAGVRVFAHTAGAISDFQDQSFVGDEAQALFPRRQLVVPKAPTSAAQFVLRPSEIKSSETTEIEPETPANSNQLSGGETGPAPTAASVPVKPRLPAAVSEPDLRAPDLLRRQLAAPKTASMSAVLSTLQSDQYEVITKPVSESQVLQGHPGTGKTIIAAHRAAYFLNKEAPADAAPRGRVLILGPTVEYVKHVQGALKEIIDNTIDYEVQALPALLENLAGLPESTAPTESVKLENVSQELARLVDIALQRTKINVEGDKPKPEDVYAELLWLRDEPPVDGLQREWWDYLNRLPATLQELRRRNTRQYLGLLAYIGVRTTQTQDPGHVIVDEAQDIHPIEWEILGRLGNVGGWTILGDLNQRRTDHTFNSWDDVARLLAIEDENGEAPTQVLENGYRSTAQIIRFANQLLPARDRKLYSLQQDGDSPVVQRVASIKDLYSSAVSAALALLDRVGSGTVALISTNIRELREILRKEGWQAETGNPYLWAKESDEIRVLPPDRARGLEFDAVVVVEPADFPENLGRQGVLYTALTRANRLLTVVHHRALARGMKARP